MLIIVDWFDLLVDCLGLVMWVGFMIVVKGMAKELHKVMLDPFRWNSKKWQCLRWPRASQSHDMGHLPFQSR
jgi:hypothetical protein